MHRNRSLRTPRTPARLNQHSALPSLPLRYKNLPANQSCAIETPSDSHHQKTPRPKTKPKQSDFFGTRALEASPQFTRQIVAVTHERRLLYQTVCQHALYVHFTTVYYKACFRRGAFRVPIRRNGQERTV